LAYVTGGNNIGRVGTILHVERHLGSFDIVHLKDANGKTFATRSGNIFIIGNKKSEIALPANEGLYYNIMEEKVQREGRGRKQSSKAQ
jgi:small subunit ribosomal protein S4e